MSTFQRLVLVASLLALATLAFAEEEEDGANPPAGESEPAAQEVVVPGTPLDPSGQRIGREAMWPAPTAEDWAKPCLITFQRTWDDAVAVAKETGKPILVCINMDGEIASEHYAGVRYRSTEVAPLYEPYVCVIASVYRHNPRDHDDEGNRILCPRFGCVTCGEHIAIEPVIFEKFCDGRRIAPRHIAVDVEGNEAYDVFYADDTYSVFKAIHDGVAKFPPPKPVVVRGDRPIAERVASRDIHDRDAVEAAYRKGDATLRGRLLDEALKQKGSSQLDLLRLAIFGLDVDQSRKARQALAQVGAPDATRLISEALRVPMDAAEKEALIAALKRLGENSRLAQWLGVVHQGLASRSGAVDPSAWARPGAGGTYPAPEPLVVLEGTDLSSLVEERAQASAASPDDPAARVALAASTLALALEAPRIYAADPGMGRMLSRHLFEDARRAAEEAEALGAGGWGVNSTLALARYYTGDKEEAFRRAEKAMEDLPDGDATWTSMALLTVFAEGRWKAIKAAAQKKEPWPPEWLTDVHAAYAVLLRHPLGTDQQVAWHHDLLLWLGADDQATRVLEQGFERFALSPLLHERMRLHLLMTRGPRGLEAAYARQLEGLDASPGLDVFAGVASVAAAEQYRRVRRYERAMQAYARAIERYGRARAAGVLLAETAGRATALAHAARARVAYQLRDDPLALAEILAAFEASPDDAGTRDGMGISPAETAQMLLARLETSGRQDLASGLSEVLGGLDPELLRPDRGLEPPGRPSRR